MVKKKSESKKAKLNTQNRGEKAQALSSYAAEAMPPNSRTITKEDNETTISELLMAKALSITHIFYQSHSYH